MMPAHSIPHLGYRMASVCWGSQRATTHHPRTEAWLAACRLNDS